MLTLFLFLEKTKGQLDVRSVTGQVNLAGYCLIRPRNSGSNSDIECKILSLAYGTQYVKDGGCGYHSANADSLVSDGHAEILARRALLRMLVDWARGERELDEGLASAPSFSETAWCRLPGEIFRFPSSCVTGQNFEAGSRSWIERPQLWLYTSTAPCGFDGSP